MLRKMLAITLAAVFAMMPMTASAVTWNEVINGIRNSDRGMYESEDGIRAELLYDTTVEIYGPGTITAGEDEIVLKPFEGKDGNTYYEFYFKGVKIDAEQVRVEDGANGTTYVMFDEETVVSGDVVSEAEGEGTLIQTNNYGTVEGDMIARVYGEARGISNNNYGEVAGSMTTTVLGDGGLGQNGNAGTVKGDMSTVTLGAGSTAVNINVGQVDGSMYAIAEGEGSAINNSITGGTVGGSMNAQANAEGSMVWNRTLSDEESAAEVSSVVASAANGGVVANAFDSELDSLTAVIGEGGAVIAGDISIRYDEEEDTVRWTAEVNPDAVNAKKVTVAIEAGSADTYTAEQIVKMIESTGLTPTETAFYTVNDKGERTAQYSVGADGTLTLVSKLTDGMTDEQKAYLKEIEKVARENHERELKRQAEKVGGVTASPEWVKQLFLGYMSLNLRMYEEGEQVLFRERLAWADEGTLNLTLRVNIDAPKALTIRFDENVLDKLEQANISVVTLLAKDSTPVMQYKVSDLRGAYTQYGLAGADLLVVGGANDEVMKIGADGEMKPVEAE